VLTNKRFHAIARNTLLFTLLADGDVFNRIDMIWNIFFHFYLDKQSLDLLRGQCRQLANMAVDVDTWRNSPYGYFVQFCTKDTLSDLRQHWLLYESTENLLLNEKERLRAAFAKGNKAAIEKYGDGEDHVQLFVQQVPCGKRLTCQAQSILEIIGRQGWFRVTRTTLLLLRF
jgi:hypothetical protein